MTKEKASKKTVISEEPKPENQAVDVKAVHIYFDELQAPQITFSGKVWSIRDILHVKRLLTREYKRYLRTLRQDVK